MYMVYTSFYFILHVILQSYYSCLLVLITCLIVWDSLCISWHNGLAWSYITYHVSVGVICIKLHSVGIAWSLYTFHALWRFICIKLHSVGVAWVHSCVHESGIFETKCVWKGDNKCIIFQMKISKRGHTAPPWKAGNQYWDIHWPRHTASGGSMKTLAASHCEWGP